ncbi:MAG: hypothetical protein ACXABY_25705 [Candidatus Thorarchaeota archaeon]|jgi:hypothetical protein
MSLKSSSALIAITILLLLAIPYYIEGEGLFTIPSDIKGPMDITTISLVIFLVALAALQIRSIHYDDEDD